MGGWFSFGILFYVKVVIGLYLALKIFLPEHEIQNVINAGYLEVPQRLNTSMFSRFLEFFNLPRFLLGTKHCFYE